jgi:hypothetical protein
MGGADKMVLAMILAAAATAQPAPVAAQPKGPQARFDAATQAAAEGKCIEAVPEFEALERLPGIARNTLAVASIAVRKGICLTVLDRPAEGEAAIRRGLPLLTAKGADFATDVREGHLTLAQVARLRFDYDAAIAEAEKALAISQGAFRIRPLQVLISLTLFDGDGRAIRLADEARAMVNASPDMSKKDIANVQTLYARALLNAGRHKEAYVALKDSLAKQGGLNLKVGIADIATRSDLAIVALLTGDDESARKYLAFTGAGRMADAPFARAAAMDPPMCDATTGLKPSDTAIVEFSLREDGQVGGVQPVYVTGNRGAALAFARAVKDWSWTPEDAKAVPLFFRALMRVELHCTNRGDVPGMTSLLSDAATASLVGEGATPAWEGMSDAAALPLQRAAFGISGTGRARLAAGVALLLNPTVAEEEKGRIAGEITALAQTENASAPVRVVIAITQLATTDPTAKRWEEGLRGLLTEPGIGADPLAASTLRLLLATPHQRRIRTRDSRRGAEDSAALLERVIAEPGLPDRHPLKVNAMLRRADLFAAGGDTAAAAAMVARTGLNAEQCAMLGITPSLRSTGANGSDFPMEAMRWGFEGWVRTEFDIGADGRAIAPRPLIAYPPFVFDKAATGIASSSRWSSSYRGDQPVACAASVQQVRFVIP